MVQRIHDQTFHTFYNCDNSDHASLSDAQIDRSLRDVSSSAKAKELSLYQRQSVDDRRALDEKDAERARSLKAKMSDMTSTMQRIQSEHQRKLHATEERTEAMSTQISTLEADTAASAQRLSTDCERAAALLEMNGTLKSSLMAVHSEKDAVEEAAQAMHQRLLELGATPNDSSQSQSQSAKSEEQKEIQTAQPQMSAEQKAKIMALHKSTHGFKDSLQGLKSDMAAIARGFQSQLLESTKDLAHIHGAQQQCVADLQSQHSALAAQYALSVSESDKKLADLSLSKSESAQTLSAEREERTQLQSAYDALRRDCQDVEAHLVAVQKELEQQKAEHETKRDEIALDAQRTLAAVQTNFERDVAEAEQRSAALNAQLTLQNKEQSELSDGHRRALDAFESERESVRIKHESVLKGLSERGRGGVGGDKEHQRGVGV